MKLVELIKFLKEPSLLSELYADKGLNKNSEAILVYMKESIDINSEIVFFEIEETEDRIFYEKNNQKFVQLSFVEHLTNIIRFDLNLLNSDYDDFYIAQRLVNYRINNA